MGWLFFEVIELLLHFAQANKRSNLFVTWLPSFVLLQETSVYPILISIHIRIWGFKIRITWKVNSMIYNIIISNINIKTIGLEAI